ncbi:hypothetical protein GCM10020254_33620 [Streptomyces goshikiensis]
MTPLPPELEAVRAAEATRIYGDPAIRPLSERKTGLISLGDSEISGEGVGNYDPATNTSANQCHRSPDSAIHRTGIPADLTFNVACSGGYTGNIRIGGSKQYADELVQSDSLAIKARNTKIKMVLLVAGANDDLQFGPVMTDCVTRWVLSQGTCEPKYSAGWQARVDGLKPKVEATVADLKTVMRGAGYADSDYKLVVMGYPSPIGPDFYDNPAFPGKLPGGCAGYDSDAQWGRNVAVPAFEKGVRAAALAAGATYLDNSRLFHGHEVCMEDAWARGLYLDLGDHFPWDENTARQSFHPNYRGHGAFASCLTQLYDSGLREASCADPASTGTPVLQAGAWDSLYAPPEERGDRQLPRLLRRRQRERHQGGRLGLPRRPQPGLVVRPRDEVRPRRAHPRPLPGRPRSQLRRRRRPDPLELPRRRQPAVRPRRRHPAPRGRHRHVPHRGRRARAAAPAGLRRLGEAALRVTEPTAPRSTRIPHTRPAHPGRVPVRRTLTGRTGAPVPPGAGW